MMNSINNISGAIQRASMVPNQRPPGAIPNPAPTPNPTSRLINGQPSQPTVPTNTTSTGSTTSAANPAFPEFKVINNVTKRIIDTNPPKYVFDQLNTVVDKLKNKEKYARLGAEFTKVIAFYGATHARYIVSYAAAIAGELGYDYIETSGMVLEANVTRIVKLFEEATKSNKQTVVLITNSYMIGNQLSNNGSRDAEIALRKELACNKNSNLVIILQTTGQSLKYFDDITNGLKVNFTFPTFGDGGTYEDRENFIKQIMIQKNIPFDYDLDLKDFTDLSRALGLYRMGIEKTIQKAAEKMVVLGHTKITFDTFDLASEEVLNPTVDHPISSKKSEEITAIHEAGHTLVTYLTGEDFVRVTILNDWKGTRGRVTRPVKYESSTIAEMKNILCMMLAGRAAEDLFRGEVTEGIGTDIKMASDMAKKLGIKSF